MVSCIPFGLAADVASASGDGDSIHTSLDNKRRKDLSDAADAKISVLERLLVRTRSASSWLAAR